jgi:hypothetical protein
LRVGYLLVYLLFFLLFLTMARDQVVNRLILTGLGLKALPWEVMMLLGVCRAERVTRHTSHVTHHTSHVTRHSQVLLLHHSLAVLDVSHNCLHDLLCKFYNGPVRPEEVR